MLQADGMLRFFKLTSVTYSLLELMYHFQIHLVWVLLALRKKFKIDSRNSPKHLLVLFLFIDNKDWTYDGWKSSYAADRDAAFRSN